MGTSVTAYLKLRPRVRRRELPEVLQRRHRASAVRLHDDADGLRRVLADRRLDDRERELEAVLLLRVDEDGEVVVVARRRVPDERAEARDELRERLPPRQLVEPRREAAELDAHLRRTHAGSRDVLPGVDVRGEVSRGVLLRARTLAEHVERVHLVPGRELRARRASARGLDVRAHGELPREEP
eukprot:29742-Pelagococcus_subviridis.AAC.2